MKVFITQYALTDGIKEMDVQPATEKFPTMVTDRSSGIVIHCYHKPHWHETRKEAVERAEQMRLAKLSSLRKQIQKLESMRFE